MQQQVHLAQQIGQRLRFAAEDGLALEALAVRDGLHLLLQVVVRLDEKAAGAAGGVEHGFAQRGSVTVDHEAHDRARRIELAGVAGCVAHLAQHRFVKRAERVQLVG